MDGTMLTTLISTVGFPIVACCGLAFFCKMLFENNNKNIERLFTMFEKSNQENREAIQNNTKALEVLKDRLEDLSK